MASFPPPETRNATICFSFAKNFVWVLCLLVVSTIVPVLYFIAVGFAVAAREKRCRISTWPARLHLSYSPCPALSVTC